MSILGFVSHNSAAAAEPYNGYEPVSAEQFVERLRLRLQKMERMLAEDEQLEVIAFLPSGKAVSVDSVCYENPTLVLLNGAEQDTGRCCTLFAHQSSIQVLVSIEPISVGSCRKKLRFTLEK